MAISVLLMEWDCYKSYIVKYTFAIHSCVLVMILCLWQLKTECGSQFTNKLEGMFKVRNFLRLHESTLFLSLHFFFFFMSLVVNLSCKLVKRRRLS